MKKFLKIWLTVFVWFGITNISYAQNGNQYEVKSGKIEFEIKRFKRVNDLKGYKCPKGKECKG